MDNSYLNYSKWWFRLQEKNNCWVEKDSEQPYIIRKNALAATRSSDSLWGTIRSLVGSIIGAARDRYDATKNSSVNDTYSPFWEHFFDDFDKRCAEYNFTKDMYVKENKTYSYGSHQYNRTIQYVRPEYINLIMVLLLERIEVHEVDVFNHIDTIHTDLLPWCNKSTQRFMKKFSLASDKGSVLCHKSTISVSL